MTRLMLVPLLMAAHMAGQQTGGTGVPAAQTSASVSLASPINNVTYVDGVTGAGIGVASSAWSSATSYPLCSAVSYSGANYLAVIANSSVTPGTNKAVWYPVANAATPTQLDCAFYLAASQVVNHGGAAIRLGAGTYPSGIGLVEPTVSRAGDPVVNIYGSGRGVTFLQLNQNNGDGFPFLYLPDTSTAYAFASFLWQDFTIDANFNANAVIGVYGAQQFTMKNILAEDAIDGSDHYIEFGDSTNTSAGWTYEADIENVDLNSNHGSGKGALVTTTVTGGVPGFTVTAGGSGYNATGSDTVALLLGSGNFGRPCSSMGTTTATVVSGVVTAVSSTASGCVAPVYTVIVGIQQINYGYKFSNASDSKLISSMTDGGIGMIAGMYLSNITSQMSVYKFHPESTVRGVQNYGQNTFLSLQCDTIIEYCFDSEAASGVTDVIAPVFQWNNSNMLGSSDYYFGTYVGTPGVNTPVAFNIFGEQCGNTAQQAGYIHFLTGAGAVDSVQGSDTASLPAYVHDTSPAYCNQVGYPAQVGNTVSWSNGVIGNAWNFNLGTSFVGAQTLNVNQAAGGYTWNFANNTPATSGQNYASPVTGLLGSYWNGSAAQSFGVNQQLTFASGSSPLATFATSRTGAAPSGGFVYSWDGAATAPGFFPQSKSAGPYAVLFDDYFSGANNASNNIGTPTGAGCAVNTTYTDVNHPGNLLLTAGTGGSGTGITCGYQSQNASVVSPNGLAWTWETAVYVPVLPGTTAGSFQAGLTGGPNANPWTTGIEFYLSSANGVANDWYCRYSGTSTDSTVAAVAATWTRLSMWNDGSFVHWYINGAEAAGCKTAVGSMPSGNQYPASWSATALSASNVTMAVDYVDFQRAVVR